MLLLRDIESDFFFITVGGNDYTKQVPTSKCVKFGRKFLNTFIIVGAQLQHMFNLSVKFQRSGQKTVEVDYTKFIPVFRARLLDFIILQRVFALRPKMFPNSLVSRQIFNPVLFL